MPSKASGRRLIGSTTRSPTARFTGPKDLIAQLHSAQDDEPSDAILFLTALDPGATSFTFQTFDDDPDRKDPKLIRILHGSFADLEFELERLNESGAGIFVTINETNGKGRKTENIERVRALFVDLDGAPLEPVLGTRPHIVVESSPRRFHAYWLVADMPLGDFSACQEALIERFGGDPVVKDLPRVMRLPGFKHRKGKPFRSRIICRSDAPPFSPSDFSAPMAPVDASRANVDPEQRPNKKLERRQSTSCRMTFLAGRTGTV
jgi:RepB DNA-primase from phage plasmid